MAIRSLLPEELESANSAATDTRPEMAQALPGPAHRSTRTLFDVFFFISGLVIGCLSGLGS